MTDEPTTQNPIVVEEECTECGEKTFVHTELGVCLECHTKAS